MTPDTTAQAPEVRQKSSTPTPVRAEKITLRGHVQGVGFRPFVYRLAQKHGVSGYVQNRLGEVEILACGADAALARFRRDLIDGAPPLAQPELVSAEAAGWTGPDGFRIAASSDDAAAQIFVPPDYFMCDDCRRELHDPRDRRHRYPFINCTQCGPRYTLIEALPYDRPNTSMAGFPLCPDCEQEYNDPNDRRFHAEPVACATCGPSLRFAAHGGNAVLTADQALDAAVEALRRGNIIGVKGIGGYHLMCDARNDKAVATLRRRKQRPDKPLAVMFPLAGEDCLDNVRKSVELDAKTATLLAGPERPIVLAEKSAANGLADNIAPGLAELGVFLPYSPLHELLLEAFDGPLVATSGNLSGEPVLTDNDEATRRLHDIVDGYLHHDRPIVRPADDPVYRRVAGKPRPLRIGRGCAPLELRLEPKLRQPALAVGGHMKGTVALGWDDRIVVSPHIGEMHAPRSLAVLEKVAADLQNLYGVAAERIVCDAHGGYTTNRWARTQPQPCEMTWHHRAHASALAGEHTLPGVWLVFTWDGVGLGEDGSLWGGEAFVGGPGSWRRVATLRPFRLPGGERAGREPWRSAAALSWECGRPRGDQSGGLLRSAWEKNVNSPRTTSAGRLFDAAAAIVLGQQRTSFEAQGPMLIEAICRHDQPPIALPLGKDDSDVLTSDWQPLLSMLEDRRKSRAKRAEIFHSSMAQVIVDQAQALAADHAIDHVGLCGGVFQNRILTDAAVTRLESAGFKTYLAERLPCNDAALSFGQIVELAAREQSGSADG